MASGVLLHCAAPPRGCLAVSPDDPDPAPPGHSAFQYPYGVPLQPPRRPRWLGNREVGQSGISSSSSELSPGRPRWLGNGGVGDLVRANGKYRLWNNGVFVDAASPSRPNSVVNSAATQLRHPNVDEYESRTTESDNNFVTHLFRN